MTDVKIAVIGCGNLGTSLILGLLDNKTVTPGNIIATKRNINDLNHLKGSGIKLTSDNARAVKESDLIIIAVRPYNVSGTLQEIRDYLEAKRHILVLVAAGVTIDQIQNGIQISIPIFRAMPNTTSNVGESLTCICHNNVLPEKTESVEQLFDIIGTTIIIINEVLMESATVLGACGVAYVLRFIRAMIQGGIQIGFYEKTASTIVYQTVKGAAELLIKKKEHPEFEIDKVTTPEGCTIAGLN